MQLILEPLLLLLKADVHIYSCCFSCFGVQQTARFLEPLVLLLLLWLYAIAHITITACCCCIVQQLPLQGVSSTSSNRPPPRPQNPLQQPVMVVNPGRR
jgi:hypothetical protein